MGEKPVQTPRGIGSHERSPDVDRRGSGFRTAARIPEPLPRLEDLADSTLDDEDTQTSAEPVEPVPSTLERVATLVDDDLEEDEGIPTIETRVDSAQMLALLAQAGLPSPLDDDEGDALDGDTVVEPTSRNGDPYDDTAPTLRAPPKRSRTT